MEPRRLRVRIQQSMNFVGVLPWECGGIGQGLSSSGSRRLQASPKHDRRHDIQWAAQGRGEVAPCGAQVPEPILKSGADPPRQPDPEASGIDWPALVERCLAGDNPAWTQLVSAQHKRVYALCFRFTGSQHDAQDLTQEVFLKIHGNLRSFDVAKGRFETWVTTLTRNLLVDHFRRTRQQRMTDSVDAGWDQGQEPPRREAFVDARRSPLEEVAQKEVERLVQAALVKLSPELREAVILRDLQDLDYKEIAEVLGIPEGTVKSRISRGRAELARLLERNRGQVV
jgi:RNA polymerase sigma-70 factor, ECF subfamily